MTAQIAQEVPSVLYFPRVRVILRMRKGKGHMKGGGRMDLEKKLKEMIESIDFSTEEGQTKAQELLERLQSLLKEK